MKNIYPKYLAALPFAPDSGSRLATVQALANGERDRRGPFREHLPRFTPVE